MIVASDIAMGFGPIGGPGWWATVIAAVVVAKLLQLAQGRLRRR